MFQGTAVLVRRLIEASADVDEPYLANNVIRMLHTVKGTVEMQKQQGCFFVKGKKPVGVQYSFFSWRPEGSMK